MVILGWFIIVLTSLRGFDPSPCRISRLFLQMGWPQCFIKILFVNRALVDFPFPVATETHATWGIYIYMYICIYAYMYICIYVYMYIWIYVYMYICICVYMYICIYVYMCKYIYIYIYMYMYICIYKASMYVSLFLYHYVSAYRYGIMCSLLVMLTTIPGSCPRHHVLIKDRLRIASTSIK